MKGKTNQKLKELKGMDYLVFTTRLCDTYTITEPCCSLELYAACKDLMDSGFLYKISYPIIVRIEPIVTFLLV